VGEISKKQPSWMTSDATSYQGEPMKTLYPIKVITRNKFERKTKNERIFIYFSLFSYYPKIQGQENKNVLGVNTLALAMLFTFATPLSTAR